MDQKIELKENGEENDIRKIQRNHLFEEINKNNKNNAMDE